MEKELIQLASLILSAIFVAVLPDSKPVIEDVPIPKVGLIHSPTPDASYDGIVTNDPACGISVDYELWPGEDLLHGETGFGALPWQVLVGLSCEGVLINNRHVVTAAACVYKAINGRVSVRLGEYALFSDDEPYAFQAYYISSSEIMVHPLFNTSATETRYDVAYLRLDKEITYEPHIRPICLPEKGEEFKEQVGLSSGWIRANPVTHPNTYRWTKLHAMYTPIVNNSDCEERRTGHVHSISDEMICAGSGAIYDIRQLQCQGNKGGPLMIQKDKKWYLIGTLSDTYSCSYLPGTYHRISSTSDWISFVASGGK